MGPKGRDAQARAAAWRLVAAACRGRGDLWDHHERLRRTATDQDAAAAAAEPLVRICQGCPIVAECRIWARLDHYDGIAAGVAWHEGRERPVHWVPGHPPPEAGQLTPFPTSAGLRPVTPAALEPPHQPTGRLTSVPDRS